MTNAFQEAHDLALAEYRDLTGKDYDPDTIEMLNGFGIPVSSRSLFLMLESWQLSKAVPEYRKAMKDMERRLIYGEEV